jgi:hypothetical protein
MSGDMESNASVLDFRVIDPPTVPSAPNAPNRPALISVVMLIALGAGLGVAFVLSQIRPYVQRRKKTAGVERPAGIRDGRHGLDRCPAQQAEEGTDRIPAVLRELAFGVRHDPGGFVFTLMNRATMNAIHANAYGEVLQ